MALSLPARTSIPFALLLPNNSLHNLQLLRGRRIEEKLKYATNPWFISTNIKAAPYPQCSFK